MSGPLRPFRLEPVFLPKVWAAASLPPDLGRLFAAPPRTGEIWLASDRNHVCRAVGGQVDGLGLDEIMRRWPAELTGDPAARHFPLLAKILCVGQWLSVQTHPGDADARRLEGEPWGKSEAWHVLAAEPDSRIIHGLERPAEPDQLRRALAAGTLAELLAQVPAAAGDTFAIPAGTVHATGPGLTIFEIQQASDVTYRLYDWDRPGDDGKLRPLHLDKALAVMRGGGPGRAIAPRLLADGAEMLAEMEHFSLTRRCLGAPLDPPPYGGARLWFVLEGAGQLRHGDDLWPLAPGQCWLLPVAGRPPLALPAPGHELIILESLAATGQAASDKSLGV